MKLNRLFSTSLRKVAMALLMATSAFGAMQAEEVPVFITIGQSNADGSAMFDADIDAQMLAWYTSSANTGKMKIWYRSTQVENQASNALGEAARWVVDGTTTDVAPGWLNLWYRNENTLGRTAMNMIHGYGTYSTGTGTDCAQGRRGMEGEFGVKFAEAFPDKELYVIKMGVSGSFISSWANPLDNHNWNYFFENVYKPAIDDLIARGKTPVLAGIWWMQGCADSAQSQAYYETWLRTLVGKLRSQLGFADAKVYVGHILAPGENTAYPNGSTSYGAGVRAAQDAVAADMEGVEIINTANVTMQYEAGFNGYLHFDHAGVNTIGDMLAEKVIADGQANSWASYSGYANGSQSGETEGGSSSPGYLDCDGTRYMRIPNHTDFNIPASGSMTISFDATLTQWAASGSYYGYVCNNYRNADGYRSGFDIFCGSSAAQSLANNFSPDGTSTSTQNVQNFGGAYITSGITPGTKAHIVMTYDGSTGTHNLYINGTAMRTTTNSNRTLPITSFADILVGCRYDVPSTQSTINQNTKLKGQIDNLRFYREALTATEVAADANGAVAGRTLIAAYDFDYLTGTTCPDITGNGHDGVLVNFPDYSTAGSTLTIEQVANCGTITVKNGNTVLANGAKVADGTVLTVEATPASEYTLGAIIVNGREISGTTFTMDGDMTISARFDRDASLASKVLVFDMNEDGSKYYRIPALVKAADGSLVAICDKRGDSMSDLPNTISVVAKRSTDNGRTWSSAVTIAQGDAANGKTYGDPAVVLDRTTGNLVCVFSGDTGFFVSNQTNKAGFYVSTSSDNGQTWTAPRAITSQLYQSNWYGAFAASGKMLQTKSGRIMFVANTRTTSATDNSGVYEFVCASDDGGTTWSVVNTSARIPAAGNGNESKIVELNDGTLIMSIRSGGKRRFSKSTDGGATWTAAANVDGLVEPNCNGDIILYPSTDGQSRLLHSIPNHASTRRDVSVLMSYDGGSTWPVCKKLVDNYSAYSSLEVLDDGTIGCLVEEGKWDSNIEGEDGFRLYFMNFSLEYLTDGNDDGNIGQVAYPDIFDGTLNCDGTRYMKIPNAPEFTIQPNASMTISFDLNLKQWAASNYYYGLVSNNYRNASLYRSGFDLFCGSSAAQSMANNFSPDGTSVSNQNVQNFGGAYITSGIIPGTTAHVVMTYNGSTGEHKIYIDGEVKREMTNANRTLPITSFADILVGCRYTSVSSLESTVNTENILKGQIDNLRFYSVALTATEVAADAAGPVADKTLIAAYDFDAIQGTTVPDITGNGHDGQLIGFPANVVTQSLTIKAVDARQGQVDVYRGQTKLFNGSAVSEGDELRIVATPADNYLLSSILVNNTPLSISGNEATFSVGTESVTVSATFERDPNAPVDYCKPTGAPSKSGRSITSVAVADNNGSSLTIQGNVSGTTVLGYQDRTSSVFSTTPGSTMTLTITGAGEWIHTYMHVDYGQDGTFDVDPSLTRANGDLVWFNRYRGNGTSFYDSNGTACSDGHVFVNGTTITFTLPEDLTTGDYRARLRLAWDNVDACMDLNDLSETNYGTACIDFTIHVEAEDFFYTELISGEGNVECWTGITADQQPAGELILNGETIPQEYRKANTDKHLYFWFTPIDGYELNDVVWEMNDEAISLAADENGYYDPDDSDRAIRGIKLWHTDGPITGHCVISVTFTTAPQSIDEIDIDLTDAGVEAWNMQGVRVNPTNLAPGIYILRQGKKILKVKVD